MQIYLKLKWVVFTAYGKVEIGNTYDLKKD
jgi:hypothetical protein